MWQQTRLDRSKQQPGRLPALIAAVVGALIILSARADSGSATLLHSFDPSASTAVGAYPYGSLLLASDGNFYGTSYSGGAHNGGTIYKLTTGGALTVVYSFGSNVSDGQYPRAGLIQGSDGNLYGTTLQGGSGGSGTVYCFNLTSGTLTTLHAFGSTYQDGIGPNSALVQGSDGYFYGTTQAGGANSDGTVFKISSAGTLTTLYSFGAAQGDGGVPTVGLVQGSDGNLYGATEQGGTNSKGTLYRITLAGVYKSLYSFGSSASDGATPRASLIQASDGNFYGTTEFGGANSSGTIYRLDSSSNVTVLYSFGANSSDGTFPRGGLVEGSDHLLDFYGTTQAGGTKNLGTVYTFIPGGTMSTLHSFGTVTAADGSNSDGLNPQVALAQGANGSFYGTTLNGGQHSTGAVFSITQAGQLSTLQALGSTGSPGGSNPSGGLLLGSDGNYYGTTQAGGVNSVGTVYSIKPDGTLSTLYTFGTVASDGANPAAALVQGSDGNFYGTTLNGGNNGYGTVFKLTPAGVLTTLHSFGNSAAEGSNPEGRLAVGKDGNFYGTTLGGGTKFLGTIFRITPAGMLTTLYSFGTATTDGSSPTAGLVPAADGSFYGTTLNGGVNGKGTVFNITPSGALTTLFGFSSGDGANPAASLLLASDGNLYGTTQGGGANGQGAIFKITPAGAPSTIYSFGSATSDGANPEAELVQGSDGNLYGTTTSGGTYAKGTVFQITPAGKLTSLYSFGGNATDGTNPVAGLTAAGSGRFYGTTYGGGANGTGTVYKLAMAPSSSGGSGGGAMFIAPLLSLLYAAKLIRTRRRRAPR